MKTIEELEAELETVKRERDEWRQDAQAADAEVDRLRAQMRAKQNEPFGVVEQLRIELDEARAELVAEQRENTRFRDWYRNAFGGAQKRETPWEVCNCEQCQSLRRLKETP